MTEEYLKITGGRPLHGEISVQGAKNSALPLMAAALLCEGETVLTNVPQLSDVYAACRILNRLGCRSTAEGNTVRIVRESAEVYEIPDEDMRAMRSSIMFLGPILGSMMRCTLTMPGGCELGPRPINLHLDAMRAMGVRIREGAGRMFCMAEKLTGARIHLPIPSVGVTENVLMAAVCAEGETVLTNAACEPEIGDLAGFLNQCGAEIRGAGSHTVVIRGGSRLHGTEYRVMPDRIAAMTYLCAGAAAGGGICLHDAAPNDMKSCLDLLEQAGCRIGVCGDRIFLDRTGPLKSISYIRTMPYPGFPTDSQAAVMSMLSIAHGTSVMIETIFENRYRHVRELCSMGADIVTEGKVAVIKGVEALTGACVSAADLRAGTALAVAGLAAHGSTVIENVRLIDRGWQDMEDNLRSLGASIERES